MNWIANTPEPPYYAVIFTSTRVPDDGKAYDAAAQRMVELAAQQPGFLGIESVRSGREGITVSYWRSEADIARWRDHAEHRIARERGRSEWYAEFRLRVVKVEREYRYER
ncbi:MAG: antibiotic biosynthesis monooxygenase [Proteobacteria bacterium]|nr:MAG: antibiotic biosynthesis monooxygenase [Pseudomonadota bacterium]QKK11121.1 MAG: antibiotic biosynthesis monooxygenase [Pseudomonadota bacterium]